MKISIVTAVYNCHSTVGAAIESVAAQSYHDIEHIVIDGMSTDGTDEVIGRYADSIDKIVREPDEGIYDALNKGIRHATGDVIGFLHADDLLASRQVVQRIADTFAASNPDAIYGDLLYVDPDQPSRTIRYWKSGLYSRPRFGYGWMPPHPTCYLKRQCYEDFGGFRTDMSISADYELLIRMMVKNRIAVQYIDEILVKMRVGGKSNRSLQNRLQANREDAMAWRSNNLRTPRFLRFTKPFRKIGQYFRKPGSSEFSSGGAVND